jgi:lysophospholipid acyltransferase (LPLAT)-like uncharacterized protein
VHVVLGTLAAYYLRLVWHTTRWHVEPFDIYERLDPNMPAIIGMWHGQHFLMPFVKRRKHRVKVLISRHRDGEVNAIAAELLGIPAIRGSGDNGLEFHRKGGVGAFRAMTDALAAGYNVALTADVPKTARVAGLGIVMLARNSGRPIYAVAIATRNRKVLNNWDRSAVNLPFGRGGIAVSEPIYVPADANGDVLESCRLKVEAAMNAATTRAYELADQTAKPNVGLGYRISFEIALRAQRRRSDTP